MVCKFILENESHYNGKTFNLNLNYLLFKNVIIRPKKQAAFSTNPNIISYFFSFDFGVKYDLNMF